MNEKSDMAKIIGRSDDILKICGINILPSQVESALIGINSVSSHYQLVVRRKGFSDTLEVRVELIDASLLEKYSEIENLRTKVKTNIRNILGVSVKVSLVEPKTIERFAGKAQRVLDLRNKEN